MPELEDPDVVLVEARAMGEFVLGHVGLDPQFADDGSERMGDVRGLVQGRASRSKARIFEAALGAVTLQL